MSVGDGASGDVFIQDPHPPHTPPDNHSDIINVSAHLAAIFAKRWNILNVNVYFFFPFWCLTNDNKKEETERFVGFTLKSFSLQMIWKNKKQKSVEQKKKKIRFSNLAVLVHEKRGQLEQTLALT